MKRNNQKRYNQGWRADLIQKPLTNEIIKSSKVEIAKKKGAMRNWNSR